MSITDLYVDIMNTLSPLLVLGGMLSLTIALIVMLINMIINSATGKGFTIGLK